MSVFDKLHKLYSTSFGPVVQARSMGLEVLNEFDTLKAAITINAGAGTQASKNTDMRATVFGLAGSAFEAASTAKKVADLTRGAVGNLLVGGIKQVAERLGRTQQ